MRARLWVVCFAGVVSMSTARANACGGCFASPAPQQETSVVTGHRMAFAVSPTRTVLWDQFQYDGAPKDFSWVLPVKPGAYVEESRDAWFEALDSYTSTRVFSPPVTCSAQVSASCACGGSSDSGQSGGGDGTNQPSVNVIHEGTVGPYETVTVQSSDPAALRAWLDGHGYIVPPNIDPIIDAYVAEGFDFVALRLQPGFGVQQMTPVRVVTPGGDYQLPLRMVAAGVGSFVGITLFVIGEGRFGMPDLPEVSVATKNLEWDFAAQTSNYPELRQQALLQNGGRTYITTFARQRGLADQIALPRTGAGVLTVSVTDSLGQRTDATTLTSLYFLQAAANENESPKTCSFDKSAALATNALVVECQDPPCSNPAPGNLWSDTFACSGFDDVEAAVIGMHPSDIWVTRLEMRLPATALDADCVLEPSVNQGTVQNAYLAKTWRNSPCGDPIFTGSEQSSFAFASALSAWLLRRSRRRRK